MRFKSSSQTFLQCQIAGTLDKPGAAHMSKIISPGQGPNTCPTTTEGKFWRNSKCGRTPLREGQLYRGNLIWIATPLQTKKIWQQWAPAIFITFICVDISKKWSLEGDSLLYYGPWQGEGYNRGSAQKGYLLWPLRYGNWLNRQTLYSCKLYCLLTSFRRLRYVKRQLFFQRNVYEKDTNAPFLSKMV